MDAAGSASPDHSVCVFLPRCPDACRIADDAMLHGDPAHQLAEGEASSTGAGVHLPPEDITSSGGSQEDEAVARLVQHLTIVAVSITTKRWKCSIPLLLNTCHSAAR